MSLADDPRAQSHLERPQKDPVSITGFVLSLTVVLSLVGLVLGVIGLVRTRGGRRAGRWAAIAAMPVGLLGTAGLGIGGYLVLHDRTSQFAVDEAQVGDCLDIDYRLVSGRPQVELTRKDCSEDHQAEVIVVGRTEGSRLSAPGADVDVCQPQIPDDYRAAFYASSEPITMTLVGDGSRPTAPYLCFFQRSTGSFTSPIRG